MEMTMSMAGSAIDCYEDMFKEITKKLYGEDGLPELTSNEKSACASQQRVVMEYESENPILKPEEHLTAFGLAALMQTGFSTGGILNPGLQCHKTNPGVLEDTWIGSEDNLPWTQSKIALYNPCQKLFKCSECDCVGYLPKVAEHWLGTHSNMRAFHCPHCHYESAWARCVRIHLNRQHNVNMDDSCESLTKNSALMQEVVKHLTKLKTKLENGNSKSCNANDSYQHHNTNQSTQPNSDVAGAASKRYRCTYCPYATDRRDLFTRHENIHREEKPFQCYVCQKQFNRADHVKKHFLRMHRDDPYDLNRIRRHPPKNASGMSYYQKYQNSSSAGPPNDLVALGALSIPGLARIVPQNSRTQPEVKPAAKAATSNLSKGNKKKGEKRFCCCYCSWSGVDNWCLKRHMNTHLKPFVCALCDYKAARSERLATHVLKVHNKRSCGKCNFLADDLTQLSVHQLEQHPLEQRNKSSNPSNVLRTNGFNSGSVASAVTTSSYAASSNLTVCSQSQTGGIFTTAAAAAAALLQNSGHQFLQGPNARTWSKEVPKAHGAARLFNYMEASDGDMSEPESEGQTTEDTRPNLTQKLQSDFHEAGGVEGNGDETELPLFVCSMCGCEFEDDSSLETHQYTHNRDAASPANVEEFKENVDPDFKYRCRICDTQFNTQRAIMSHMVQHTRLVAKPLTPKTSQRRQGRLKKPQPPFWEFDEAEVLKHLNGKLKRWKCSLVTTTKGTSKLVNKYMAQLVTKRGFSCFCCKNNKLNRFHSKACIALHKYWRHAKKRLKCEYCDLSFRRRYQTILHTSRVHRNKKSARSESMEQQQTEDNSNQQAASSGIQTSPFVPNTMYAADAHKLAGMPFFDHSLLHTTGTIGSHMPIIIPTFPPN